MYIRRRQPRTETETLRRDGEANANRFNLKCLTVQAGIAVLSAILALTGLFPANKYIVLPGLILAMVIFLFPAAARLLLLRRADVLYLPWFKPLILSCAALGLTLLCVTLSMHGILCLAILPILAAQYRMDRRLFRRTLAVSLLMVPIGVYGCFFFGVPDRNLMKTDVATAAAAATDLSLRLSLATPERMVELLTHYVLPRLFAMVVIVLLVYGIANRHSRMLERQTELSRQVREEIERLSAMQSKVIDALATLIENRDEDTGEHVIRTKLYVRLIGKALLADESFRDRFTEEELDRFVSAAPLHDVGKIAVSDSILLKPGRLTPEEFEQMKLHTVKGGGMLKNILGDMNEEEFLKTAEDIALYHHERWDGTGYPRGLRGEDIPLSARIMAAADVFDALVSPRVYKQPVAPEEALEIMLAESGTHFDPEIMRVVRAMGDTLIAAAKAPIGEQKQSA